MVVPGDNDAVRYSSSSRSLHVLTACSSVLHAMNSSYGRNCAPSKHCGPSVLLALLYDLTKAFVGSMISVTAATTYLEKMSLAVASCTSSRA